MPEPEADAEADAEAEAEAEVGLLAREELSFGSSESGCLRSILRLMEAVSRLCSGEGSRCCHEGWRW